MRSAAVLALAVLAVSWASILIRLCEAPALTIAFWRLAISALCLAPFAAARPQRSWLSSRALRPTLVAGIFLGLHFASWITSLKMTSVASSVVLATTTPVFSALLSARLLGERPGRAAWIGIAVSLAGAALIAWGDSGPGAGGAAAAGAGGNLALRRVLGDLLALAGAFFVSSYLTAGRSVRAHAPLVGYLAVVYGTGSAALALFALARGNALTGYSIREYGLFASIAVVPNLIGHSLLNWGVRRMRTYVVNVAVLGEPVLATIYAAFLFGEIPGRAWALGTALILAGVATIVLAERSRAAAEDALERLEEGVP